MSRSTGDFGYGSISGTEFGDRRPLVADPRGNRRCTVFGNELCLWHSGSQDVCSVLM